MAKSIKSATKTKVLEIPSKKNCSNKNTKFIVPMPGKGSWHNQPSNFSTNKIHNFSHRTEDLGLEDFRAQFLMEREFPID